MSAEAFCFAREESEALFFSGQCDAMTADASELAAAAIARSEPPDTYAVLDGLLTQEPLAPLLCSAAAGRLPATGAMLPVEAGASVALTLAAAGYPDGPRSGDSIDGVGDARWQGALVFGAGVGAGADALPATDIEPRENGEPETGG